MSNTLLLDPLAWRNRYLLMRHAHSEANRQGCIVSSPARGIEAFGLSSRGWAEVDEALAAWHWATPTRVVHSDFLRTTQTAARVAAYFGVAKEAEVGLRERGFGELEGGEDARYADVWAWDALEASHVRFGVEPVTGVSQRLLAVLHDLERRYQGEVILLVSHGDPLQILLTTVAGDDPRHHRDQPSLQPAVVVALPGF